MRDRMRAECGECGETVKDGDTAYYLGGRYFCAACVKCGHIVVGECGGVNDTPRYINAERIQRQRKGREKKDESGRIYKEDREAAHRA